MYCKYRDSLSNIRYSYRGKNYRDVPVHRCIIACLRCNHQLWILMYSDVLLSLTIITILSFDFFFFNQFHFQLFTVVRNVKAVYECLETGEDQQVRQLFIYQLFKDFERGTPAFLCIFFKRIFFQQFWHLDERRKTHFDMKENAMNCRIKTLTCRLVSF